MERGPSFPAPGQDAVRFLQPMFADLLALVLGGRQARWHLRGGDLWSLHRLLGQLVADAGRLADEVAERLVELDVGADGRLGTVATTTSVPEFAAGFLTEETLVDTVLAQIDAVILRARDALGPLERIDRVSQDIILGIVRGLEDHRWRLARHLSLPA